MALPSSRLSQNEAHYRRRGPDAVRRRRKRPTLESLPQLLVLLLLATACDLRAVHGADPVSTATAAPAESGALAAAAAADVAAAAASGVVSSCFQPEQQIAERLSTTAVEKSAARALAVAHCYAGCKQQNHLAASRSTLETCYRQSCGQLETAPPPTGLQGQGLAVGLEVLVCSNSTVHWTPLTQFNHTVYVIGLIATDNNWAHFQVVHNVKSHASLLKVLDSFVIASRAALESGGGSGCYQLAMSAVSKHRRTHFTLLRDQYSLEYLHLTGGSGRNDQASKCGGDLSHLGSLADTTKAPPSSRLTKVSLSHFELESGNTSRMNAVINVSGSEVLKVVVQCQFSYGLQISDARHRCEEIKIGTESSRTTVTIPGVLSARDFFVRLQLFSVAINITANITFTAPNMRPSNFVVKKISLNNIRASWTLALDPRLRLTNRQRSDLHMKVFWRKLPSRMQSTQLSVAKRQATNNTSFHDGTSIMSAELMFAGYEFTSVPLETKSNGQYSRIIHDLVPEQKYSVRVMGPTGLTKTTGLLTDVVTYDPALYLEEKEKKESVSWFKKPLAIILFSVCGALLMVIIIICCFLGLSRRRTARKRRRRTEEEEKRKSRFALPAACLGLSCYPPSSAWVFRGNSNKAPQMDSEQNTPMKAGQQHDVGTAWVFVDKTPRDTPDILSIVDESESHVRVRQATPGGSRTSTPSGDGRPAVARNLRTTGKATTIFRPLCKSTEHLDVPDFTRPTRNSAAVAAAAKTSSKLSDRDEEHSTPRSRFNTMSNPIRQSMRKKKAKVMVELQQLGRGKPSSLKHRMQPDDLLESLNTDRLSSQAKDELRVEGFKVSSVASPFSSGRSTPTAAVMDEWEIPFEQLYLQDLVLDAESCVTMKAELVNAEYVDENGLPVAKGGENATGTLGRSNSLRKATLSKSNSKQPVVRSTSLHASSLTRKVVAVKMLKDGVAEDDLLDFRREIGLMKRVGQHRHLLSLLGCCTLTKPLCMIGEHAAYGDLLSYMRSKRPKKSSTMSLQSNADSGISSDSRYSVRTRSSHHANHGWQPQIMAGELLDFVRQILQAMSYLSSRGVVHRNLCSRTILLGGGHQVKLADFGLTALSARCESAKGDQLKWMSLESILERAFTTQSDIWAFGVVLWEVCTLGDIPYADIANKQLLDTMQGGYRMRKPDSCSDQLYMLMLSCWSKRPTSRPSFKELEKTLEALLAKSLAEDHVDVDVIGKSSQVPLRKRPSSVSHVPPLALESTRSAVRITHSQPTTPRGIDTVSFTWLNPSDSEDSDVVDDDDDQHGSHDDGDGSGQPHFGSSSVSVFSRSIGSGPRSGTASNRSSVHFADEKLPRLIQASSKEEVMRARSGSWNTPSAALAIERHKQKSRQQATAEKVTIFDQNSSKSLTLQPSSYYLNEMRKYRESGQLPMDATRYSISPDVAAVVVNGNSSGHSPSRHLGNGAAAGAGSGVSSPQGQCSSNGCGSNQQQSPSEVEREYQYPPLSRSYNGAHSEHLSHHDRVI